MLIPAKSLIKKKQKQKTKTQTKPFWVTFHLQTIKLFTIFKINQRITILNTNCRQTHPGSPQEPFSGLGTKALLFGAQLKGLGHVHILLPLKALVCCTFFTGKHKPVWSKPTSTFSSLILKLSHTENLGWGEGGKSGFNIQLLYHTRFLL